MKYLVVFLVVVSLAHFIGCTHTPDEWKSRVIYQLLTDRFARLDNPSSSCCVENYCGGTFNGITSKLDYIQSTGANAVRCFVMVMLLLRNVYAVVTNVGVMV